jgi:hypothetical protein
MSFTIVNLPSTVSFVSIDTRTAPNKVIMLPAASTVTGRLFTIKDQYGGAGLSTYRLSTIGMDKIDGRNWIYTFSNAFGAISFLSDGRVGWRVVGLYDGSSTALPRAVVSSSVPTTITGGIMWLDATLLSGANGAAITTWTSASDLYSLYMTGSGTLNTNILNGKQVISVNTSQSFSITNTSYTSASFTFFFVSRQTGGTNGRVFLGNGNTLYGYWGGHKNQLHMEYWQAGPYASPSDTNWDIYTITRNSSGAGVFSRFGTTIVSFGNSGAGMTGFYINTGGCCGNEKSDAQIAEVIIYNVVVADADCRKIEGYLAWKWGLQANLPVGHPYKSSAP